MLASYSMKIEMYILTLFFQSYKLSEIHNNNHQMVYQNDFFALLFLLSIKQMNCFNRVSKYVEQESLRAQETV